MIRYVIVCSLIVPCFLISFTGFPQDAARLGTDSIPPYFRLESDRIEVHEFLDLCEDARYDSFFAGLIEMKEVYALDDWFYYKVINYYLNEIYAQSESDLTLLMVWYSLNKAGYDVRLEVQEKGIYLFVYTLDKVNNSPQRRINDRNFVCLNCLDPRPNINAGFVPRKDGQVMEFTGVLNENGKAFSFIINRIPELPDNRVAGMELGFKEKSTERFYLFRVRINQTVLELLEGYPNISYGPLFCTPFSEQIKQSFIVQLKEYIKGRSTEESLNFISEFIRSEFLYEHDTLSFGYDKRFTPEESVSYPYLDSEDRSALFFAIVKEILGLPMVILSYPSIDHVTIGVLQDNYGVEANCIVHKGRRYRIFELMSRQDLMGVDLTKLQFKIEAEYSP